MQNTDPTDPRSLALLRDVARLVGAEQVELAEARWLATQADTDTLSVLRAMRASHFLDVRVSHRVGILQSVAGQPVGTNWTPEGVEIRLPSVLKEALAFC